MKKIAFLSLLCAVIFCGCAKTVVVSEVLQQGENDRLYTQYNIFYNDPAHISCLNFIQGNIIPFGTEIEVVECNEKKLVFKTVNSETLFSIDFSKGERMASMQQYLRTIIGFDDREGISKNIRPEFLVKVQNGEVAYGMTKDEVSVAWGKVPPVHTPDEKNMTWIYMRNHHDLVRLIFKGNVLRTSMPKLQEEE